MGKENGFEFTPKDGGIGMPEQKNTPYEAFKTDGKMRRSASQGKIFDNNGGDSKGDGGGVVESGYQGSVSFGAP
jgi:hypothetical protein